MAFPIRRLKLACTVALSSVLLAACGGGSEDGINSTDQLAEMPSRESAQAVLGPIPNGGFRIGLITAAGASNSHTFTVAAGQSFAVSVARITGNLAPKLTIFGPTGQRLWSNDGALVASETWETKAPTTGIYTAVVQHRTTAAGTGSYEIHFARGVGPKEQAEHGGLFTGIPKNEVITIGDLDSYTFAGVARSRVVLKATRTSGTLNPQFYVYDPSGARISSSFSYAGTGVANASLFLTVGGTYTVVVRNSVDNGATGGYQIVAN